MNQVITEVLLFVTFCSLQPERRGQPQHIKALFTACQVPSVQLLLEPHLIQRPITANYKSEHAEGGGKGILFKQGVLPTAALFCFPTCTACNSLF